MAAKRPEDLLLAGEIKQVLRSPSLCSGSHQDDRLVRFARIKMTIVSQIELIKNLPWTNCLWITSH